MYSGSGGGVLHMLGTISSAAAVRHLRVLNRGDHGHRDHGIQSDDLCEWFAVLPEHHHQPHPLQHHVSQVQTGL